MEEVHQKKQFERRPLKAQKKKAKMKPNKPNTESASYSDRQFSEGKISFNDITTFVNW